MWVTTGSDGCLLFVLQDAESEEISSTILTEIILEEVRCSKGFAKYLTKILFEKGRIEVRPWKKKKRKQND